MNIKVKGERLKVKGLMVFALCSLLFVQANAQELLNYPLDTIDGEEVYKYEVERSIGLYRIGVNFNVSQSEIIRLNPQLRERGLHYAEILYIPTGRPVIIESKPQVLETVVTETTVIEPVVQETGTPEHRDTVVPTDTIVADTLKADTRRVVVLALMLPFESQQTKRSGNAERMLEFYQGALLALRNLQNDSTLYRLRIYDTERSERRVNALCDSTELDSVRGVLGLIYPIQIERMSDWCSLHQVPLLLPFSDDIDLASHPQVLQFNSTDSQEADSLCAWMMAQDSAIHVVAVDVKEADLASSVRVLRRQMKAKGIGFSSLALRDLMIDSCAYALDSLKENVIVLHSDRFQNVRMVMTHLHKLRAEGYKIRIVSQYSWQKENIGLPQVHTSVFKTEGEREAYEALWADSFAGGHVSETPRYDLLGYDLMQALVKWIEASSETVSGIQSDIRWTQVNNRGFQNACVRVVTY